MPSSRIPSPARSQGAKHTPRRYKPRFSRSVGSPARSDTSVKLSAVVRMDSFVLSPMPTRRSVLTDTTDIDIPRRKSWWKKLDENSREIMEVINNKEPIEANNAIEEYIDVDVLSQEKKNYTLDLPESSDGESINSIVIPQRKLFTQKQSQGQNKFGQIMDKRETVTKLHETQAVDEKDLNVGPKNLFNQGKKQRIKPIFPSALLNISANKTLANKTKELPPNEAKGQVKSLFGNRPGTKRKNMFADFIVSESEDEISEIQHKVFGFQKKLTQKSLNLRDAREQSPTSSMTDVEMDDWRLLPSSTMVDHQLEDGLRTTPSKRARLSKLSEAVESVNTTASKTKQSNKTVNSKSRSKNASKFNEMEEHELISPTNDDELDAIAHKNHSKNISSSRMDGNSKNITHEKSLKKQTSKMKEHSKSKNSSHMKTVNDDVESEAIVNNEDNKNNKSKQNKTSNTLTKIDQALQSDDDEDFTLEYENDDEGVEDIDSNKTAVDNAPQISHQNLKNSKNSNISANINMSKQPQNKTKNQSIIQQKNPQINSDEGVTMQESEVGPYEKEKSISPEVDKNENNQNSNDNQDVQSHQRDISYNKSLRYEKNMSKNASHTRKHQEYVELNEFALDKILDGDQAGINEAIDDEQNNCDSNKVDEKEIQEDNDNNQENSDDISDKNQSTSQEVEDDKQHDPESDEDEVEQTDEVQNSQKLDEEMIDDDKNNSREEINNEEIVDENEEIEGENEEIEDKNEDMGDQDEEMEEKNYEIEDADEEEIVEENQNKAANVTAVDNNDESQEPSVDNEDGQEATGNNEGEEGGDISDDIHNNDESQENVDGGEEEEMQESDQNVSQEVESEEEEVPEAEDDEQEAQDSDQNVSQEVESEEDEVLESEDDEQEAEDSDQNEKNVSQNSQENVSQNDQENEETEDQEDEVTREDSREEEMEQSDDQNESEEEIDKVNESEDEVDNNDESAEDERDTADMVEADETHDTTGRHRNKQEQRVPSPEAILHDKTNPMESFTVQGRNTSVRKTKSMIRKNRSPSLAPVRESTGLSDGVRDSSAEGSGWDSHRTTRLTIRQTIGRDFTPRKSLRALVMEKSAKRHTNFTDTNADIKEPQANSTELPRHESFDVDNDDDAFDQDVPSDHEESRRMRQTTLEMYLQKVKEKNLERKKQLEDEITSSLKAPTRDMLNPFKVPAIPKRTVSRVKPQNKAKAKLKSVIPLNLLPAEVLEDMKYKPPKRYQPANASWITKRLYKFLEAKLEPKYDYKARVRSEKLVETLYNFTKDIRRLAVAPPPAVDALKQEMARLNVVGTHVEFYEFFHEYMPREVRVKVVPDVFNKISLPKHGVFSDILR